ncbi:hypothetical protein BVG79_00172 [Ketogulonicigenium robustum]|uniref:Uncharacterized protein n=1 Tax=Ketogulonicigenium robustum TaxID=92947 RepID=A0A1W6NWD0_9RHOB|nr:hypothetical protein BVG79_00172 [Ketogulonicigenium robustum]
MADGKPDWAGRMWQGFGPAPSAGDEDKATQADLKGYDLAADLEAERAAIMEYDGGLSRRLAERKARQDIRGP